MDEQLINKKYAAEVKQSDIDHHQPTAGAMTSHVIANLVVQRQKLQQMLWSVKGMDSLAFKTLLSELHQESGMLIGKIGDMLVDIDETVPTTTAEFQEYTMLEEDPKLKYYPMAKMIAALVADYRTADLFILRAIKLAQKEEHFSLALLLTTHLGDNQHHIRVLQGLLNQTASEEVDGE